MTGSSGDVAQAACAMLIGRRDGTVVHVSDAMCRMLGRPAGEVIGRDAGEVGIVGEPQKQWVLSRLPETGQGYRYTRMFNTPQGPRLVEVELHGVSVDGQELIAATYQEVSPQTDRGGDAAVLGAVIDGAPVGVVVFDAELRIMRVNRGIEGIGRLTAKHIGVRLADVRPGPNERVVAALREVFETGEPIVNLDISSVDGHSSYLVNMFVVRDRDGAAQVGCVYTDITPRLAAERALAESERHRRSILASMLQAEDAERSRIATELHDDTVQVMTASLLAMDRVAIVARKVGHASLESAIVLARATLEEATERTRRLMFELRPAVLHENGLAAALGVLADQTAREADAQGRVDCVSERYEYATEELVYRTVQEALANVRKHADPLKFTVSVQRSGVELVGEVFDDGRGFDVDGVKTRPQAALHLGLDSIVERVRAAGGDVTISSQLGVGTSVRFAVPVDLGPSAN